MWISVPLPWCRAAGIVSISYIFRIWCDSRMASSISRENYWIWPVASLVSRFRVVDQITWSIAFRLRLNPYIIYRLSRVVQYSANRLPYRWIIRYGVQGMVSARNPAYSMVGTFLALMYHGAGTKALNRLLGQ